MTALVIERSRVRFPARPFFFLFLRVLELKSDPILRKKCRPYRILQKKLALGKYLVIRMKKSLYRAKKRCIQICLTWYLIIIWQILRSFLGCSKRCKCSQFDWRKSNLAASFKSWGNQILGRELIWYSYRFQNPKATIYTLWQTYYSFRSSQVSEQTEIVKKEWSYFTWFHIVFHYTAKVTISCSMSLESLNFTLKLLEHTY